MAVSGQKGILLEAPVLRERSGMHCASWAGGMKEILQGDGKGEAAPWE